MDLVKIYTKEEFNNAVIPEGQALIFTALDESGNPVTMYKDKDGNFGTIAGSSSDAVVDVTLGQVNAEGKFQPLAFNGTEASNSGSPETVEAYYGFNGVLPVPESGGGGGSVGCSFYKCTSVYGPEVVVYNLVAGASYECNGKYTPSETLKNGYPVYEFINSSGNKWYMYFLINSTEGDNWVIADRTDVSLYYQAYYFASSITSTWHTGMEIEGDAPTVTQGKETLNADQEKTWDGKKAVKQDDGAYKYEKEITTLSYGDYFRPEVGFIYNEDATAQVSKLKMSSELVDPVFHLPLESFATKAESGQTIEQDGDIYFTRIAGMPCAEFKGGYIKTTEDSGITGTQSRSFAFWALPTGTSTYVNAVGCGNSTSNCGLFNCGCKLDGSNINFQFTTWGNDINKFACTNDERLHHFCYVFDSDEPELLRIYVDGVRHDNSVSDINTSQAPFFIGRSGAMNGWIYYGYIANVKCYNVAFTDEEVAILYEEMM